MMRLRKKKKKTTNYRLSEKNSDAVTCVLRTVPVLLFVCLVPPDVACVSPFWLQNYAVRSGHQ